MFGEVVGPVRSESDTAHVPDDHAIGEEQGDACGTAEFDKVEEGRILESLLQEGREEQTADEGKVKGEAEIAAADEFTLERGAVVTSNSRVESFSVTRISGLSGGSVEETSRIRRCSILARGGQECLEAEERVPEKPRARREHHEAVERGNGEWHGMRSWVVHTSSGP